MMLYKLVEQPRPNMLGYDWRNPVYVGVSAAKGAASPTRAINTLAFWGGTCTVKIEGHRHQLHPFVLGGFHASSVVLGEKKLLDE